jgi:hypothetical protein
MHAFLRPLTVVLLAAAVAPAADPVRLSPEWVKGDKVEYELTKGRERTVDGKMVLSASTTTPITVEVLKAGKDEVELSWTFGETKVNTPAGTESLGSALKGQAVIFTLSPKGGIGGVKNLEALGKVSGEMVELLVAPLKAGGAAKGEIDLTTAVTKDQFAKREGASMLWAKDQAMLFFPVGETLEAGKPKEVAEELPNPFGGAALPTKRRVELTKVDAKAGTATVTMRSAFDEKAVESILGEVVKAMTKKLGKEPPNAAAIKGFRLTDDARYTVSTRTGWVESASYARTVTHGLGTEIEINEFVRKGK